jgi:hypothetical protein
VGAAAFHNIVIEFCEEWGFQNVKRLLNWKSPTNNYSLYAVEPGHVQSLGSQKELVK